MFAGNVINSTIYGNSVKAVLRNSKQRTMHMQHARNLTIDVMGDINTITGVMGERIFVNGRIYQWRIQESF